MPPDLTPTEAAELLALAEAVTLPIEAADLQSSDEGDADRQTLAYAVTACNALPRALHALAAERERIARLHVAVMRLYLDSADASPEVRAYADRMLREVGGHVETGAGVSLAWLTKG